MTIKTQNSDRIEILDGFRFIAILSVLLYHFYTRWTPPIYPDSLYSYLGKYNYFRFGYMGVHFFFIISGFVIASTLETTSSFQSFFKKRIIRLFPALLICSLISFSLFNLFDPENLFPRNKEKINLIYSLTLINPEFINLLLRPFHIHGTTIAGSYWSLWPEVQFYILAAVIYYSNPSKFLIRFFLLALGLYLVNQVMFNVSSGNIFPISPGNYFVVTYMKMADMFNLVKFILWFLAGILFFQLYSKKNRRFILPGLALIFTFLIYDSTSLKMGLIVLGMFSLFFTFIYYPDYLRLLKFRAFTTIGLVSYSLYLIHENLGVLLIHKYAGFFEPFSGLFPLFLILVFVSFSILLYKLVEKPLANYLKKRIL